MGKNINQIATFYDLYDIGYRVGSDAKQGVTYYDLSNAKYVPETADLRKMIGLNIDDTSTKCVKWSDIPGTDGQNPDEYGPEEGVRCPVKCTIINQLGLNTYTTATNIIFYYNYKTKDGGYGRKPVGRITLGQNGQITQNASGICAVLVNPKASYENTNPANWLSVWCGTHYRPAWFKVSYSILKASGIYTTVAEFKSATSCETWTDVKDTQYYNTQLRQLEEIRFIIS